MNALRKLDLRNTNRSFDIVLFWRRESPRQCLLLDPPYQRGDVWGRTRRRNLIRSLLMGVPIPSIVVNNRLEAESWGDDFRIAVIDGRQRIRTLFMFADDRFSVPADWFDEKRIETRSGDEVFFSGLTQAGRRLLLNSPIPFSEARVSSIEQEREIFELINFGGLQQGQVDEDLIEVTE